MVGKESRAQMGGAVKQDQIKNEVSIADVWKGTIGIPAVHIIPSSTN